METNITTGQALIIPKYPQKYLTFPSPKPGLYVWQWTRQQGGTGAVTLGWGVVVGASGKEELFWIFTESSLCSGYALRYRKVKFTQVEDSPSSPSRHPHQLTVCVQLRLQPLLPCQMRDDLDVDKIFVLSWLWGQILSLFPLIVQHCESQQHPEQVQNQHSERSHLLRAFAGTCSSSLKPRKFQIG